MNELSSSIPVPAHYKDLPGGAQAYEAICRVLSDRGDQVAWDDFSMESWRIFPEMAVQEGVAPLLYWAFKDGNTPEGCPRRVFETLKSEYYNTLANNTLLLDELERILAAFDEAGIPAIVLKGAALAGTLYENIGLRPMGDLDLLVKREEFERSNKCIQDLGFRPAYQPLTNAWKQSLGYHNAYIDKTGIVGLEIHWNILAGDSDWREPNTNWFWEQNQSAIKSNQGLVPVVPGIRVPGSSNESVKSQFSGWGKTRTREMRVLSPTANLLYLAAHLFLKHGGQAGRLIWLYDLAILIETEWENGFDLDLLAEKANAFNWTAPLYQALVTHQVIFSFQITQIFQQKIAQRHREATIPIRSGTGIPQPHSLNTWNYLKNLNGSGRVKAVSALLFPSINHIRWRYQPKPSWLWPVYYVQRWGELIINLFRAIKFSIQRQRSMNTPRPDKHK